LRRLIVQFPNNMDLQLSLLELLERTGKVAEARRLALQMRQNPLADAGVRTAIGEMYLRLEDEPEARRVFSEIVEFAPRDELARRRLGDLYRAHGWFEEAYRQYQTLASIRPDDPSVNLLLAQAAAGAGRVDEALRLEQALAQTGQPGEAVGMARTALLWSSVRFAELREAARRANDSDTLSALLTRMRRSGVMGQASPLRVSLVWSHPDADLSLWASYPGLGLSRPTDLSPEYGIEAFDVREAESGVYRVEVRRQGTQHLTPVEAKMVIVWREGEADERVEVRPLAFTGDTRAYGFTIEGDTLAEAPPTRATGGR
jgi:Ca-activated chloride channel family protein